MNDQETTSYLGSGVDIDAGADFADMIKERVAAAWPDIGSEIGGFGGGLAIPLGAKLFVGSADGTGTKAILAALAGNFSGIGRDAVAMSVVDTYVSGGAPPYALYDVLDVAKLDLEKHIVIIDSIIAGCQQAGCVLLGGETAELPDMFKQDWMINLNTFALSFPSLERPYEQVRPGQAVYGWPSNGPASNGFSLIRKALKLNGRPSRARQRLDRTPSIFGGKTLADVLLEPTPIWIREIEKQRLRGVRFAGHAHITGGGLVDNIPRILPPNCNVVLDCSRWKRPPIFRHVQEQGPVDPTEMNQTFNQGIIVVSIVADGQPLEAPDAFEIGTVVQRNGDEPQVQFINSFRD